MVANQSALRTLITIGGQDWSPFLLEVQLTDNHIDQSGWVKTQAEITLVRTEDQELPSSLDDRVNPLWSPGTEIILEIDFPSGLERFRTLYIQQTEYQIPGEGNPEGLRITAGCRPTLLNFPQPTDPEKAGVTISQMTSRNAICTNLLNAAGLDLGTQVAVPFPYVPYPINYPLQIQGSYLDTVGQLLYSAGFLAWQDPDGRVQAKPLSLNPSPILTLTIGEDEIDYRRLTNPVAPREIIRAVGTTWIVRPIPAYRLTTRRIYQDGGLIDPAFSGLRLDVGYDRIQEFFTNANSQKSLRILTEKGRSLGLIFPETKSLSIRVTEVRDETKYFESEQDRLVRHQISLTQFRGVAFPEWFEDYGTEAGFGKDVPMDAERQTIDYAYDSKDRLSEIRTLTYQSTGQILSGSGQDWSEFIGPPTFPRVALQGSQAWTEKRPGVWESKKREEKPLVLARPDAIGDETTTAQKLDLTEVPERIDDSIPQNDVPPATERAPSPSMEERQVSAEVRFAGFANPFRERERTFQIPFLAGLEGEEDQEGVLTLTLEGGGESIAEVQCRQIAQLEGAILYGRYRGQLISFPITPELLQNWQPLSAIDCVEPDGTTRRYLLDGASWVLTPEQALVSFDAIWVGTVKPGGFMEAYPSQPSIQGGIGLSGQISFEIAPLRLMLGGLGLGGQASFGLEEIAEEIEIRGGLGLGGQITQSWIPDIGG